MQVSVGKLSGCDLARFIVILENCASSFSDRDTNRAGNELFYSFHIVTCYLMLLQFLSNSESMKFIEKIAKLCGFTLLLNFVMLTVKKHQHLSLRCSFHVLYFVVVSSSFKETIKTMIFGIATRIDILNFIAKMEASEEK